MRTVGVNIKANQPGTASPERLAHLTSLNELGVRKLAADLEPQTDALLDRWARLFAEARRDRWRPRRPISRRPSLNLDALGD